LTCIIFLSKCTFLGDVKNPTTEDIPKLEDIGFSPKPLSKRKVAAGPASCRYKGINKNLKS
jgi:hypothetical protein